MTSKPMRYAVFLLCGLIRSTVNQNIKFILSDGDVTVSRNAFKTDSIFDFGSLQIMTESDTTEITIHVQQYETFHLKEIVEILHSTDLMEIGFYDIDDAALITQLADFLGINFIRFYIISVLDHFDVNRELVLHESLLHLFDNTAIKYFAKVLSRVISKESREFFDTCYEILNLIKGPKFDNDSDVLNFYNNSFWETKDLDWANENGSKEFFQFLVECGYKNVYECIYAEAVKGNTEIMLMFIRSNIPIPEFITEVTAEYGHLNLLKFFVDNQVTVSPLALIHAASSGHIHILEFLHETFKFDNMEIAMTCAASQNQLATVIWLFDHGYGYSENILCDAWNGDFKLHEWFYKNIPKTFNYKLLEHLIFTRNLQGFRYVYQRCSEHDDIKSVVRKAIHCDNSEILQCLCHEFHANLNQDDLEFACRLGMLESVKVMLANGNFDVREAVCVTLQYKKKEIFEYFVQTQTISNWDILCFTLQITWE